jgi:hypothetical protein
MRSFIRFTALLLLSLASAVTVWADMSKMEVVNNTGTEIAYLFVSPGDSSEWGPDLLDSESFLEPSDSHEFMISYDGSSGKFDIMLVTIDGESYTKFNQTISSKSRRVTIAKSDYDGKNELEMASVTLYNNTGFELYYLFFSPEDSSVWGPDILRSNVTLEDGDSYSFYVPVSSAVTYNVRAIDEDDDEYVFDLELEPNEEAEYEIDILDLSVD